jgi:hypothetical protein
MAGMCVVCHEKEATLRCRQCGKAICSSCSHKDANGAFCSRGCGAQYREYLGSRDTRVKLKKGGMPLLVKLIGAVVVLAIVVFALIKLGIIKREDVEKAGEAVKGATEQAVDKAKEATR